MRRSINRLCVLFAALGFLAATASPAAAEIIQSYTAIGYSSTSNNARTNTSAASGSSPFQFASLNSSATTPSAAGSPPPPSATFVGTYTSAYAENSTNYEGQSVYIPAGSGSFALSSLAFNFYTGGVAVVSGNNTTYPNAPTPYAPAGTALYVFTTALPASTYTPANLAAMAIGTNGLVGWSNGIGATTFTAAQTVSPQSNYSVSGSDYINFTGSLNALSSGNTYYFYVGYTRGATSQPAATPNPLEFDTATMSFTQTPYGEANTAAGDERSRSPGQGGTSDYLNYSSLSAQSMTLFTLFSTPEPGGLTGLLGMAIMGSIGVCVGFARKRKPVIR